MVCYIINYILWIIQTINCSVIKCFVFEPKKKEGKRWKYVALLVLLQLPFLTLKFVYGQDALIRYVCLVTMLIWYVAFHKIFFECYLWQAILLIVFELCCSLMAEIIAQALLKDILAEYTYFTLNSPFMVLYISIGLLIIPILFLLVCWAFKRFVLKRSSNLKVFYIFSIFPVSQIILLFSVNKKFVHELTPNGITALIGIVIGIIADVVLLITLLRQQRMQELSVKINEMEKTWEVEQNHYRDIEARREELAKIRHDLSEQFIVIQELLRQERYETAQEMLGILKEDVSNTKEYVYCADSVVNAIMAENEKLCLESGIRFDYDIQILRPLKLNPVVICSLFTNLLRNAIAAAKEKEDLQQSFVSIKAAVKGDYLHLRVENSYVADKKKHKKSRKGYGLSILKSTAEKYDGRMDVNSDAEKYSTYVVVENIEDSESFLQE